MFQISETNPHFGPPRNEDEHSRFQGGHIQARENLPASFPRERSPPSSRRHFTPPPPVPGVPSQVPRPPKKNKRQEPRDSERQRLIGPWQALAQEDPSQRAGARREFVPEDQYQHAGPQPQGTQPTDPQEQQPRPQPQRQTQDKVAQQPKRQEPQSPAVLQSQRHDQHTRHRHQRQHQHLWFPPLRRTKLITWFLAGFCAIFWIVIILGGLIVLMVYLVFRPHSPSFQVSSVTLNAAYLDVDVLLNADLTLLAKFINPNKKVKVDFSYVAVELYYGKTMIASQYVEPFRAERLETRLATIHLVSSQVRLPLEETVRLRKEIESNAIVFQVKGVFRARSSLGSFLRYSYRLYGYCTIVVTGPPTGVLKAIKCRTKR